MIDHRYSPDNHKLSLFTIKLKVSMLAPADQPIDFFFMKFTFDDKDLCILYSLWLIIYFGCGAVSQISSKLLICAISSWLCSSIKRNSSMNGSGWKGKPWFIRLPLPASKSTPFRSSACSSSGLYMGSENNYARNWSKSSKITIRPLWGRIRGDM